MKTLFFKKAMPAATAVLAIAGAFATTSMQSASSAYQLTVGYVLEADGTCGIPVACSTIPNVICRASYPAGPQAFGRDPITGNCIKILYKP